MAEETYKFLEIAANHHKINTILELGGGTRSTPLLRNIMAKKGGYVLTLESSQEWKEKIESICPEDSIGKVHFCDSKFIGDRYQYDFNIKEQFDLIFVDGPSFPQGDDRSSLLKMMRTENNPTVASQGNGSQSMHMLDYVLDAMHNDSIVVLDGRVGSFLYWVYKWRSQLEFNWAGSLYGQKIIRSQLKKGSKHLSDIYDYKRVTFVNKKKSNIFREIFS